MLDKRSKKLLKFLDGCEDGQCDIDDPGLEILGNLAELTTMAAFLEQQGYIEIRRVGDADVIYGISLAHKGRHRREFSRLAFGEYLRQNWIAIAAFLVGLASLAWQIIDKSGLGAVLFGPVTP